MSAHGLGEMYKLLHAMNGQIGQLNGKFDTAIAAQAQRDAARDRDDEARDQRHERLEGRVRKTERKLAWAAGLFGAVGTLLGFGGAHAIGK